MVKKTHAKRKRDIKTKLMAAICMLLVSSIMMVSTTYAWFTLSTAPEVTGINTAVGANGNLEIALLPKTGAVTDIGSAVGDSMLAIEAKNVTWGNLVDLRDSSVYGLDSITLYPAALNTTGWDAQGYLSTIGATLLKTPSYGSEGRVATLNANTSNGYYDATEKNFFPNELMGVRAVGTASGMTPRQLAYRNARSAASTAAASAKTVAAQSLNSNGSTLANVAIKKGTGQTEFNMADLNAMKNIVDDLLGVEGGKTGALQHIETAYKNYILAFAASAAVPVVKTTGENNAEIEAPTQPWNTVEGAMNESLATMYDNLTTYGVTAALPDMLTTAITSYGTTLTNVQSAQTKLNTLIEANKATYTWTEISDVLYLLADPDNMEVNGIKAGEIMQEDNMSALVNSVASGGLKVSMASGGGVYADIADHCGDYTAGVVIEEVTYNKLTLKNMTARMETKTTVKPNYLAVVNSGVEAAGAPASGNTANQPITDMFGYVIDLAFRTNAAESKLLLQDDAIDRIYGDTANEGTMGHGSNMTFNLINSDLNDVDPQVTGEKPNQVRELMKAIRLVFFTPGTDSNAVIMCAKLDATGAEKDADGIWKADLVLYKMKQTAATPDTYTAHVYAADTSDPNATYYVDANGSATVAKADLVEGTTYYLKTAGTSARVTEEPVTGNEIMALTQNNAHKLSVLVYLDGNLVGNDDVAAAAATSMVGQLNLQFASSATLVPMDYSQLHTPNTAGGTTGGGTTETPENPNP